MRTAIYLPFLLSPPFFFLSRLVCRRTSPRAAAWSVTVAMALLATCTGAALALLAWPLAARLPLIAHLGGWRPGAVGHGVPVPEVVSVLASVALPIAAASLLVELVRVRRDLLDASAMHAGLPVPAASGSADTVDATDAPDTTDVAEAGEPGVAAVAVVHDRRPIAHALAGTSGHRGKVVVSTGILALLDDSEQAAVLAHERAHLRHGHRLFVIAAGLAGAMNPLVSCRRDLVFALERWADEDAAAGTSRTVTAKALAKAALAKLAGAGSAGLAAMDFGRLGVPQRVAALLDSPASPRRTALAWIVAGVALVGIVAVARATRDTEHLFEVLQRH